MSPAAALVAAVVSASTLLAGAAVGQSGQAVSSAELERLRSRIEGARERVGEHEKHERALLATLEEIERKLEQLSADVAVASAAASAARKQLVAARIEHDGASARLAETQAAMARRAVALYKAGEVGPVQVLFTSSSARELLSRVAMLESLVAYDAALVARFRSEAAALDAAQAAAEEAARASREAEQQAAERGAELSRERGRRVQLLSRVRDDRSHERALLVELERAARALEETLAALGSDAGGSSIDDRLLGAGGFAAQRGMLPPPVDAEVAQPFGRVVDAEYLTETVRKGVEYAAPAGDPVRAVAFGEVRFAGWFRGYGKIVILDHGGRYFTVSGHLEQIDVSVGQMVAGGERLGTVGETGSLTGPSLYFEIRQSSQPLDPADWLQ